MRLLKTSVLLCIVGSIALMQLFCTKPNDAPLRWQTKLEVPVSNQVFNIAQEFPKLFSTINDTLPDTIWVKRWNPTLNDTVDSISRIQDNSMRMRLFGGNVADSLNTVAIGFPMRDTVSFRREQDTLKTQKYLAYIGPISLSKVPSYSVSLPTTSATGNLGTSVAWSDTADFTFDSLKVATIDATSGTLNIIVKNRFANIRIDSIRIGVISGATTIWDTITFLTANNTDTAKLDIRGRVLDSTTSICFAAKLRGGVGASVVAGDNVLITLSPASLTASSVTVYDAHLNYTADFVHNYEITDTIDINHVDLKEGAFAYQMDNYTPVPIRVSGDHQNIWNTGFSNDNGYDSLSQLVSASSGFTHSDSISDYVGALKYNSDPRPGQRSDGAVLPNSQSVDFASTSFNGGRIFPRWDSLIQKSVTPVRYHLESKASIPSSIVTLRSSDSLRLSILSTRFKFDKISGVMRETFVKVHPPSRLPIKFPWPESGKASLRGSFKLTKVTAKTTVTIAAPEEAYMQSYVTTATILNPRHAPNAPLFQDSTIQCVNTDTFQNVNNGATYVMQSRIENVVNQFPDSIELRITTKIPKGKKIVLKNDLRLSSGKVGGMTVDANLMVNMLADFDWTVNSAIRMDLGHNKFTIPNGAQYFQKMDSRLVQLNLDLKNNSNIQARLFALIRRGNKVDRDSLDSMSVAKFFDYATGVTNAEDNKYINIFGTTGVSIPIRGDSTSNSIQLNDTQIDLLLDRRDTAGVCEMRWFIQWVPQAQDQMLGKDNIYIKSLFHFEGVNNMDSLFIWKNPK